MLTQLLFVSPIGVGVFLGWMTILLLLSLVLWVLLNIRRKWQGKMSSAIEALAISAVAVFALAMWFY